MRGLLNCCYELMELELRAYRYENLFTLLHIAERIDLLCSGGIIEVREPVFGEGHKIVDNTPEGGDESPTGGGLTPDSKKAQEHADRYYESVRKMKNDHERIAENTDFSAEEIKQVKVFIFLEKHDLGGPEPEHFYPSYEISQSWQRLIDGKNIQKHDITLIKHELMEKDLMAQGYSQNEAHRMTEQKYGYATESREYYAKADKHKDE